MKNKKGFTLIELLAVIVILSILLSISVVSVNNIRKKQEAENRRNVISGILTAARRFSVDHPELLRSSVGGFYLNRIYIADLINNNYLEIDLEKYPFFLYNSEKQYNDIIEYCLDKDKYSNVNYTTYCRYVDLMLCSTDSNRVKTYFQFYDRKEDRVKFKNTNDLPYNDCGCDDQISTAKKICATYNGDLNQDPGDKIY